MAFTIQTVMNVVIQEPPGGSAPQPLLLPWEKRLQDEAPYARIGGGLMPPHSNKTKIDFPGITTLTTLWFYPAAEVDVYIGGVNSTPTHLLPGACIGYTHGSMAAASALAITYQGSDPAGYYVVWAGG